jgi:hypothetical protein
MTRQTFIEQLVADPRQAGSSFGTFTTAKTVIPATSLLTLPANFFDIGKALRIRVRGGIGTLVTTPGTITFQVMVGAVIAFTTGAIQLNATAHTNLPFMLDIDLICRAIGNSTTATLMGMAVATGVMFTNTAAQTDGANTNTVKNVPATAPAVGTGFDSTIANILDFFVGFSISDAANTVKIELYTVESLN